MRPIIPLHLVQALLAFANPTHPTDPGPRSAISTAGGGGGGPFCPAGDGGQSPFVITLGLVHPHCLPSEVVPEVESFESFEEWKARQAAEQAPRKPAPVDNRTHSAANSSALSAVPEASVEAATGPAPAPPPVVGKKANRYNYASPDCSARVLSSSPLTQHASSLLHKSKDRYMLTPCRAGEHFVVVELCDEIRISAFEIAVWEFFSGVVRSVRLSVGGEETEEWKPVGEWVGKNVRGVQVSVPLRLLAPSCAGLGRARSASRASDYGSRDPMIHTRDGVAAR